MYSPPGWRGLDRGEAQRMGAIHPRRRWHGPSCAYGGRRLPVRGDPSAHRRQRPHRQDLERPDVGRSRAPAAPLALPIPVHHRDQERVLPAAPGGHAGVCLGEVVPLHPDRHRAHLSGNLPQDRRHPRLQDDFARRGRAVSRGWADSEFQSVLLDELRVPTLKDAERVQVGLGQQWQPIPVVLARTGFRVGELLGLRLSDVDFLRRTIRVERQRLQSGRIAPLKSTSDRRTVPSGKSFLTCLRGTCRPTPPRSTRQTLRCAPTQICGPVMKTGPGTCSTPHCSF